MATILLVIIYIAFISLGIPDSLLGTAWPAMYPQLGVSVSMAGFVSLTISTGTIISSLVAARLILRFGTDKVTAFSTLLCALSLVCFSFAPSYIWLIIMAIPLGFGGGAIDIGLNNYVALHYNVMQMNLLHAFYGIGVSLSPFLMSIALGKELNWRMGYRIASCFQFSIAILLFLTIPLWKKALTGTAAEEEEQHIMPYRDMIKNPGIVLVWILYIVSCAIEATCGVWGSTFIVESKGLSADTAALFAMCYYLGLTCGRLGAGLLSKWLDSWKIVKTGLVFIGLAIFLLLLPLPASVAPAALFMIGFGNGPTVPNFNHLTPQLFGRDTSQSVMASQMTFSYVGILGAPALFGLLSGMTSLSLFPWYLGFFFIIFIVCLVGIIRRTARA